MKRKFALFKALWLGVFKGDTKPLELLFKMTPTPNDIKDALSYDSLAAAERLTGESYKESDITSDLGMLLHLEHNERKKQILKESKDTCSQNTMDENIAVILDLGFEEIIREDIPDTDDQWMIFWKPGILLFCESYWGAKTMNSGNVCFNYDGPYDAISGFSGGLREDNEGNMINVGSFDIREGLRHRLTAMEAAGTFMETWIEQPFLWLLHYNDTKKAGYDYEAINADRIGKLPQHIQTAISPV